jgi:hypothetical protein
VTTLARQKAARFRSNSARIDFARRKSGSGNQQQRYLRMTENKLFLGASHADHQKTQVTFGSLQQGNPD